MPKFDLRPMQSPSKARQAAYTEEMPIGDQLDAILKGLAAYNAGEDLPKETLDLIAKHQEIKARIPKGDPKEGG